MLELLLSVKSRREKRREVMSEELISCDGCEEIVTLSEAEKSWQLGNSDAVDGANLCEVCLWNEARAWVR